MFFLKTKIDALLGNIILFVVGAREQKFCPNELKIRERGQKKIN